MAAVVDANIQTFFFELGVTHRRPLLTPKLQGICRTPIGSGNGIEHIVAFAIGDAVAVFIKHIFSSLLQSPFAVLLDRADGTQKVEVWVVDAAFFSFRFVNGEVHHHATADKMLGEELSGKGNVFFLCKFILKGNVEAVGKLCFLSFLCFLHGVP